MNLEEAIYESYEITTAYPMVIKMSFFQLRSYSYKEENL